MALHGELLEQLPGAHACGLPTGPPWQLSERQQQLATYEVLLIALAERERRILTARAAASEARARAAAEAALTRELSAKTGSERASPAASPASSTARRRPASFGPRLSVDVPRAGAGTASESPFEMAYRAGAATLESLAELGRASSLALSAASTSPAPHRATGSRSVAAVGEAEEWRLAFGLSRREHRGLAAGMRPPEELRAEGLFADGTTASVHYHLLLLSLRRPHHFSGVAEFGAWAERRLSHVAAALCCALAEADLEAAAAHHGEAGARWSVPALLGSQPAATPALRDALVRAALAAARGGVRRGARGSVRRDGGDSARQGGVGRLMLLPSRKPPTRRSSGAAAGVDGAPTDSAAVAPARREEEAEEGGWDEAVYVASIQTLSQAAWQIYAELDSRGAALGPAALGQRLPVPFPYAAVLWSRARAHALDQLGDGMPAGAGAPLDDRGWPGAGRERGATSQTDGGGAAEAAEAEEEAEAEAEADGGAPGSDAARARELGAEAAARRLLSPLAICVQLSPRRRLLAAAALALGRWRAAPLGQASELDTATLARCLRSLHRRHFPTLLAAARGAGAAAQAGGARQGGGARSAKAAEAAEAAEAAVDSAWARRLCASVCGGVRPLLLDYHLHARTTKRRAFKQTVDAFAAAHLVGRALTCAAAAGRARGAHGAARRVAGWLLGGAGEGERLVWPPWDNEHASAAVDGGGGGAGGAIKRALVAAAGSGSELLSARGHAKQLAGVDGAMAAAQAAAVLWPKGPRAEDEDLASPPGSALPSPSSAPRADAAAAASRPAYATPYPNGRQAAVQAQVPAQAQSAAAAAPKPVPSRSASSATEAEAREAAEAADAWLARKRARKRRADALYKQGLTANSEGDFRAARDYFDRSHALDPHWATVLSTANMRLKLGEVGVAVELYEAVLRAHADAPPRLSAAGSGGGRSGSFGNGSGNANGVRAAAAGRPPTPTRAITPTRLLGLGSGSASRAAAAAAATAAAAAAADADATPFGYPTVEQASKAKAKLGEARAVRDAWRAQLLASYSTDAAVAEGASDARSQLASLAAAPRSARSADGGGVDDEDEEGAAALRDDLLSCACVSAQAVLRRLLLHASPPLEVELLAELTIELRDAALLEVGYFGPAFDAHVLPAGTAPASADASAAARETSAGARRADGESADGGKGEAVQPAAPVRASLIALRVYGTAYAQIAAASLRKLGAAVDAAGARPGRAEEQVEALERSMPLWPALAQLDDLLLAHGGRRAPLLPTQTLLEPLAREWINYQSARFSDRLELLVAEETWTPLDETGAAGWHAASVVDLFSLFMQTIKAFLAMPLPHTAEWSHDICRVADLICNQYVNRMLQQLGPRSRLVPPRPRPELEWMDKAKGAVWRGAVAASKQMPPITLPPMPPLPRAAGAAGAGWSGLLNQFSGTASTSAFSTGNGQPGASPAGAAAYGSKRGQAEAVELARRSTAAATTSVKAMCVRINSLVFAHAQLATLRGFVLGAWERLRIADAHDPRTGERYAHTLLRASDATLKLAAREVSAHMGIRVCFVDTRGPLLDELHAQPPRGAGVRAHVLRSLLEQLLSPALETVLALVEEGPTRTHALLGICCAAASAYERVLLDGGEHRVFTPSDAPILRADAEALCSFFVARDRYGVPQGLPEDLVEAATRRLHAVLDLFEVSSETLIAQFASAPETDKLKAVTQLNLARVLVHRPDELARKWARDRAKQIVELLVKHEQTNCFADELLPEGDFLDVASRKAEEEAQSAGAEDAASLPIPMSGHATTAADIAMRVNLEFAMSSSDRLAA